MMALTEKFSCKSLLNDNLDTDESGSDDEEKDYKCVKVMVVEENCRAREVSDKSKYIDYSSIPGTAACFERLWSERDDLMTKRCKGIYPITTEKILILKKNKVLWTLKDVVRADKRRVVADKENRAEKRITEATSLEILMKPHG